MHDNNNVNIVNYEEKEKKQEAGKTVLHLAAWHSHLNKLTANFDCKEEFKKMFLITLTKHNPKILGAKKLKMVLEVCTNGKVQ